MKLPIGNNWKKDLWEIIENEQERGVCIFCLWHPDTMHQLAKTLIGFNHIIIPAFKQTEFINEEKTDNYKIVIPKIKPSHALIQILSLENKEIETIIWSAIWGWDSHNNIERIMETLNLEDKVQWNIMELTNEKEDLEYDFSSLLDQEEKKSYKQRFIKNFYQRKKGKSNTKWFSKTNYQRKK